MKVLILGCGWVGEAFAQMLKALGHTVYASTTNIQKYHRLQADGISVVLADFDKAVDADLFPQELDYILNSIPATASLEFAVLSARFQAVAALLKGINYKKQIYLSSVGVYPALDAHFTEQSEVPVDSHLREAELQMLNCNATYVYRLGGLFGGERVFAKYFEGRICTTGDQPANFVHRDDVLQLIYKGFRQSLAGDIYNVVCPEHPLKKDVILASAAKYGFAKPKAFLVSDVFKKYVSGAKLASELKYTFKYSSPIAF